jgi:hypothetical protein
VQRELIARGDPLHERDPVRLRWDVLGLARVEDVAERRRLLGFLLCRCHGTDFAKNLFTL